MSPILGFWKAKHTAVVEDLGIERDIFVLCWDFPTIGTAKDRQLPLRSNPDSFNTSEIENFCYFRQTVLGHSVVGVKNNFSEVIVGLHLDNWRDVK
ncbi:hypothetical protein CerSpe_128470 [Prunus speciosa]